MGKPELMSRLIAFMLLLFVGRLVCGPLMFVLFKLFDLLIQADRDKI